MAGRHDDSMQGLMDGAPLSKVVSQLILLQASNLFDEIGLSSPSSASAEGEQRAEVFRNLHCELKQLETAGCFNQSLQADSCIAAAPLIMAFLLDFAGQSDGGFRVSAIEDLKRLLKIEAWLHQMSNNACLLCRLNRMLPECRYMLGRLEMANECQLPANCEGGISGDEHSSMRTVMFDPGNLGMAMEASIVRQVSPGGQAQAKGVQVGWRTHLLNGDYLALPVLRDQIAGQEKYNVTFLLEELEGAWQQEGRADVHVIKRDVLTFSNMKQVKLVRDGESPSWSITWEGDEHRAVLADYSRLVWDEPLLFGRYWVRATSDKLVHEPIKLETNERELEKPRACHELWTFFDVGQLDLEHASKVHQKVKEEVDAVRDHLREAGARLVVIGGAGAGKSSCINAMFRSRAAATGAGLSVTKDIGYYEATNDCPVHLYDTKGFEATSGNQNVLQQLSNLVHERNCAASAHGPCSPAYVTERLHAVWYIIDVAGGGRFDPQLMLLVHDTFKNDQIPIIIVMNKCDVPADYVEGVKSQLVEHCPWAAAIVEVVADPLQGPLKQLCEDCGSDEIMINPRHKFYVCDQCGGQRKSFKPNYGFDCLVQATSERLPDMVVCSLLAAQKTALEGMDSSAIKVIVGYVLVATSLSVAPLLFVSDVCLVGVVFTMIRHLASIYDVLMSTKTILYVLGSLGGSVVGLGVRCLGTTALKLIPGCTLGGIVADAFTSALAAASIGALFRELFRRLGGKALMSEVNSEDLQEVMALEEMRSFFDDYLNRIRVPLMELAGDFSSEALEAVLVRSYGTKPKLDKSAEVEAETDDWSLMY